MGRGEKQKVDADVDVLAVAWYSQQTSDQQHFIVRTCVWQ